LTSRATLHRAVIAVLLLPLVGLAWGALQDGLGANPVETITAWSGEWTLRLLLVTLLMSPLRQWFHWRWPVQIRRMLGLFTFFYVCVHFLTFVWFDHGFLLMDIVADIVKRPYITVGFITWCVLLALAVTSNGYSVRRLRRNWQRLHRGAYIAALGGIVHYTWLIKADYSEPMLYLGICMLLFTTRLFALLR